MTFEMQRTKLEGFPIQYGEDIVGQLNRANSKGGMNNRQLEVIGRAVDPSVRHSLHGATADGYGWFGTLEFNVESARVAVLFPWSQDWDHPETQMDRSINVYSDRELPNGAVEGLLEKLAYQRNLLVV